MTPVDLLDDDLVRVEREKSAPTYERGIAESVPKVPEAPIGTCHICNDRPATRRCVHCEQGVCAQDTWTMLGLCKRCATDDEIRRGREGADRKRPELGIKWIEE